LDEAVDRGEGGDAVAEGWDARHEAAKKGLKWPEGGAGDT
jgi:hypothetical protein